MIGIALHYCLFLWHYTNEFEYKIAPRFAQKQWIWYVVRYYCSLCILVCACICEYNVIFVFKQINHHRQVVVFSFPTRSLSLCVFKAFGNFTTLPDRSDVVVHLSTPKTNTHTYTNPDFGYSEDTKGAFTKYYLQTNILRDETWS